MLIMSVRSSSVGSWSMCPMKYFLSYVIGKREQANFKTIKGSISHKALELLARKKQAEQELTETFCDPELSDEHFSTKDMNFKLAMLIAWEHYTRDEVDSGHTWTNSDFSDCCTWVENVMKFNGGMFWPLNRHIIRPEQYFEFELNEPWAKYDEVINGERLTGNLVIKGTVDLLTETDGIMEMIDWKTGARVDWATGKEKDYDKILNDFQLRLYHLALTKLFPNLDTLIVTIFFLRDGGPYTIVLSKSDLPDTLEMVREKFEEIKKAQTVNVIYPGTIKMPTGFKMSACEKFCHYRKITIDGKKADTYNDSMCNSMNLQLKQLGIKKVTEKYIDLQKLKEYSGGGREKVEQKNE